jgi:hypothetical protein
MNTTIKNSQIVSAEPEISLHAASGDKPGEIELLWQPVKNAKSYVIQISQGNSEKKNWKHADIVTRSKYTAAGLKSGRYYSFRIAPITENGQQDWSEFVTQKAS